MREGLLRTALRSNKPPPPSLNEKRRRRRLLLVVILLLHQRLEVDHGVEFLWGVAKEGLEVADEPIDVALVGRLVDDVLVVVLSQAAAKLLIVHLGLVIGPRCPWSDLWV